MESCSRFALAFQRSLWAGPFLLGLCVVAGCGTGDDGPKRFNISGRITFAPDDSKGNKGPAGWALIQAGNYDTAAPGGMAPVGGAMTVIITGYGEPPVEKVETQEPLFQDYKTTAEVDPGEAHTLLDFEVPATSAKKP